VATERTTDDTPSRHELELWQEQLEAQEDARLSPCAQRSRHATRRIGTTREGRLYAYRTEFQRDRDRIVHSRAFRRLRHKTQVFISFENDHFRNRLTHSLEVSQLSRTVARALSLNEDLVEAISLGHDVGHPTFGHSGEAALNEVLQGRAPEMGAAGQVDAGGFKHNYQSLRVVDLLERQYEHPGLNLTDQVREGILKHTATRPDVRYPDLVTEGLYLGQPAHLEGQLVNLADDVAQQIHDLDDGLRNRDVEFGEVSRLQVAREVTRRLGPRYEAAESDYMRRAMVMRGITHLMVASIVRESAERIRRWSEAQRVRTHEDFRQRREALENDLIALAPRGHDLYHEVRSFVYRRIIAGGAVSLGDDRARRFVKQLFKAYHDNPRLMDDHVLTRYAQAAGVDHLRGIPLEKLPAEIAASYHGKPAWARAVGDYIGGMTDRYCLQEHERIFAARPGIPG
jgi:dGTPase